MMYNGIFAHFTILINLSVFDSELKHGYLENGPIKVLIILTIIIVVHDNVN